MIDSRCMVFSDFNGTLLDTDLVGGMAQTFVPSASRPILEALTAGTVTEREGLRALYGLYHTPGRAAYHLWAQSTGTLRPGAAHVLTALGRAGVPVHILSSGLREWVEPRLAGLVAPGHVWANDGDWTFDTCRVTFPTPCDSLVCQRGCALCKPTVMHRLGAGWRTVMIGDGVTDVAAALAADVVLARPPLTTLLDRIGRPYYRYDTFDDVLTALTADRRCMQEPALVVSSRGPGRHGAESWAGGRLVPAGDVGQGAGSPG